MARFAGADQSKELTSIYTQQVIAKKRLYCLYSVKPIELNVTFNIL